MRRHQCGFSLIELVMVITITGVIAIILTQIFHQSFKTYLSSQSNAEIDWQGFLALERFANDVQSIRSPSDVTTVTGSQLVFVNNTGATITYEVSGNTLMRNTIPLAIGVSSVTFSYYDKNYVAISNPLLVRYVAIDLNLMQQNMQLSFKTMASTRGLT